MPSLPRSVPAAQGVDARGILTFLDNLEADGIEMHSLVLVRHGHVVAEGWWAPYTHDRQQLVYEVAKTFTATAAALAIDEGLFDLDTPVTEFFPQSVPLGLDPKIEELTVHHLLSMSTGHERDVLPVMENDLNGDMAKAFLSTRPPAEVGSRHVDNNGCSVLLGLLVEQVTGEPLADYVRTRLVEPLGIAEFVWSHHPSGSVRGSTGVHTITEGLAALGELYLRDGVWRGTRLLPEGWVDLATQAHVVPDGIAELPDHGVGYGYQLWMSRNGYRADGAGGQLVVVLPEHDAVVATTAAARHSQQVLDHVWDDLLPALGDGVPQPDPGAQRELQARLAALSLPVGPAPSPERAGWNANGMVVAQRLPDAKGWWYPTLFDLGLQPIADGWALSFAEGDEPLSIDCGDGRWLTSVLELPERTRVPVAATASADGPTAWVEVVFLETPHVLHIDLARLDPKAEGRMAALATATMRWNTPPLHARSLADLRA